MCDLMHVTICHYYNVSGTHAQRSFVSRVITSTLHCLTHSIISKDVKAPPEFESQTPPPSALHTVAVLSSTVLNTSKTVRFEGRCAIFAHFLMIAQLLICYRQQFLSTHSNPSAPPST